MRKYHVVKNQGRFVVVVAPNWTLFGLEKFFHCYEGAMRFYRYHVSFLGWKYGGVLFVPSNEDTVVLMEYTNRV